jgi:putative MATE family efflux protein
VTARASAEAASPPALAVDGDERLGTLASVWRLAWPAIVHQLSMTMVFMADRALVGHSGGRALASMQVSTTIAWTLVSLLSALAVGTTALVSRHVGERDRRGAALATRLSLGLGAAIGLGVAIVLLVADGALLEALFPRVEPSVLVEAERYLAIALVALPIAVVEAVAAAALQASGDTRTPLTAAAVANVLNLAVSAALIFGVGPVPALGVAGAAIGSALAFAIQAIMLGRALRRTNGPLALDLAAGASVSEYRAMAKRLLRVSGPAAGEKLVYHGGYIAYVAVIALLGATAMAANQALISIEALSYQTAEGFGIAAGVLVGQRLGEGRPGEAARSCGVAAGLAVLALSGFALLFLGAPRVLLSLFSDDPNIVQHGVAPLTVAALSQPVMAFAVVVAMALRAAGATRILLVTTAVCAVGLRLGATWLFAMTLDLGLLGVWLGSSVDWLVHATVLGAVLIKGGWRRQRI